MPDNECVVDIGTLFPAVFLFFFSLSLSSCITRGNNRRERRLFSLVPWGNKASFVCRSRRNKRLLLGGLEGYFASHARTHARLHNSVLATWDSHARTHAVSCRILTPLWQRLFWVSAKYVLFLGYAIFPSKRTICPLFPLVSSMHKNGIKFFFTASEIERVTSNIQ